MRNHTAACAAALMLALAAAPAAAAPTVIDFESMPGPMTAYSISGVTFTTGVGGTITPVGGPNGTTTILGNYTFDPADPGNGVFDPLRADFASLLGRVSVDLGDWPDPVFGDAETIYLDVYDSADNLLGSTNLFISAIEPTMPTLTVSAPGIRYAIFGAFGGGGGSSVYADNFTFDTAVPEPATWATMILGLGGVGALIRRRRPVPA